MKRLFSLLIVMLAVLLPTKLWAQEPYAVLTTDYNTILDDSNVDVVYAKKLTFYYDNQKTARNGMSVGPFTSESAVGWAYDTGTITTVEFDASFANYHPTSTSCWFYECRKLTTIIGIENLRTDQVTDMIEMFCDCSSLTTLDLRNFNTANVTNMQYMFSGCLRLETIYVGGEWTTAAVTEGSSMFSGCDNLVGGEGTTFDADHIDYTYAHIDGGSGNPGYFTDIADKGKVNEAYAVLSDENTKLTFYYDKKKESRTGTITTITTGEYHAWTNSSSNVTEVVFDESFANYTGLTSTKQWFWSLQALTSITNLNYLNTANVTNMSQMFGSCSGLLSLDLSNFNTSNATDISQLFTGCKKLTSLDLSNFDTSNVTDMNNLFRDCHALTSINLNSFNTANVTDMWGMFMNCDHIKVIDISSFNTSKVTNMSYMFAQNDDSHLLKTIYAGSGWSTESVSQSEEMFSCCYNLWGGRGSGYDAYRDEEKTYARLDGGFDNPGYFTEKDVPLPYTVLDSNILTFYYDKQMDSRDGMIVGEFYNGTPWRYSANVVTSVVFDDSFANCTNLTTAARWFSDFANLQSITGLDILKTDNIVNMQGLFNECHSLKNLNVSSFNTSNVTNMRSMFWGCKLLKELDLSNFNTSKVTNMSYMFTSCDSLTTIYVGNAWTIDAVNSGEHTFLGSDRLVGGAGTAYDYNQTDYTYAHIDGGTDNPGYFTDIADLGKVNEAYAVLTGDTISGMTLTFYYDKRKEERNGMSVGPFENAESRGWNDNASSITTVVFDDSFANDTTLTSTAWWFNGMKNLTNITSILNLYTANVTDMESMFYNCSSLTYLYLAGFNTQNVKNMRNMFSFCSGLMSLDVTGFNTQNVTDMSEMFIGCYGLRSLDLSSFNTANVTNMYGMFSNCTSLTSLDLSSFNTSNVTGMNSMFSGCSNLGTIYAGGEWTTAAVTGSNNMFEGCTNLVGGEGTAYDSLYVDATYAHIDGGISNPGYFTALGDTIVYAVQVTAGGSGAVTANGQTARDDSFILNVKKGRSLTLTFTPDEHYGVDNLTVNGTDRRFSIVNNQFVLDAINEATTVNVHFAPAHVVTIIASGNGRISPRIGNTTLDFEIREETYQLEVVEGDSASIFVRADGDHRIEHVWYNDTLDIRMGGEHGKRWNGYGDMAYTNVFDAFYWEGHVTTDTKFAVQFKHMPVVHTLSLTASKRGTVRLENREVTYELTDGQRDYNIDEYDSLVVTLIPDENCSLTSLTLADSTNLDNPVDITSQVVAQSDGTLRYVIPSMTDFRAMTVIFDNDNPEPYAVLAGNTLTFYYDKKKDSRGGIGINSSYIRDDESSPYGSATTAVFDASFANYHPTSTAYWFNNCSLLTSISGIENLKTDQVTDMDAMFYGCSALQTLDVSGFKTDNVIGMYGVFDGCESLTSLDVSGFNTQNVTHMHDMFAGCSNLTSLNVSGFKTDNVDNMGNMFGECSRLTSLDLSNFKTDKVQSMDNLFRGCSSLTSVDISGFKTDLVTSLNYMFWECSHLTSIDLSNFNTQKVESMYGMFYGCSRLTTVYVGDGWSTAKVQDGNNMFNNCTNLVGDQGTVYDAGHTDVSYAHWDGGTSNPGYLSRALQMGDANGDGSVNIADAVATVTHILGETGEGYFYTSRADMNNDSVIDIFDVTLIVNAVFDAATPAPAITRGGIYNIPAEAIRLTADANGIYMDVDQAQQYTAFQFDMSLPKGMSLVGVKLASGRTDHQVSFVKRGDNEYRVVGLSMSNETLSSADGHLIELQVSDAANEGRVKISNVLFVTPAGKTVTGIDELLNTTMATDGNIYNLKGEKLGKSMQQLGKGVYIMNHKKVIIK